MKKSWKWLALGAALLLLLPAYASAAASVSASKHFPNDKDANTTNVSITDNGTMNLQAHHNKCASLKTSAISLTNGTLGEDVALQGANALCKTAQAMGYLCEGQKSDLTTCSPNNSVLQDQDCCDEGELGSFGYPAKLGILIDCKAGPPLCNSNGLAGYKIDRNLNALFFEVKPFAAVRNGRITSVNSQTSAGNTIQTDLLENFITRVEARGQPGNIDIRIEHTLGGGPAILTPIATAGKSDLEIHQEIAGAINGAGLGLAAVVQPFGRGPLESHDPEFVAYGHYVAIRDLSGDVTDIALTAAKGQMVVAETTQQPLFRIPTLSEWGLALLIAVMLLSAAWMIRRRTRGVGTA